MNNTNLSNQTPVISNKRKNPYPDYKKPKDRKGNKSVPIINEYDQLFEAFLQEKSIALKERHFLSEEHLSYFTNIVNTKPIKTVLEIGFYYGHVSEKFLSLRDDIVVISVDNSANDSVVEFSKHTIDEKYPSRHLFLLGDSSKTLDTYSTFNPQAKVDLIYIDGSIYLDEVKKDVMACQKFAHGDTIVIVNSLKPFSKGGAGRYNAWNYLVNTNVIIETGFYNNNDLTRTWGEGRYNLTGVQTNTLESVTMAENFWKTNPTALLWTFGERFKTAQNAVAGRQLWEEMGKSKVVPDAMAYKLYLDILRKDKSVSKDEIENVEGLKRAAGFK